MTRQGLFEDLILTVLERAWFFLFVVIIMNNHGQIGHYTINDRLYTVMHHSCIVQELVDGTLSAQLKWSIAVCILQLRVCSTGHQQLHSCIMPCIVQLHQELCRKMFELVSEMHTLPTLLRTHDLSFVSTTNRSDVQGCQLSLRQHAKLRRHAKVQSHSLRRDGLTPATAFTSASALTS